VHQLSRRRLLLFAGLAIAAPSSSFAQQQDKIRRIGYLAARFRSTPASPDPYYDAFVQGMRDLGYVEGRNLLIEWRFAEGKFDRIAELAAELVKLNVEVIVTHGTPQAQALKRATAVIPIVFTAVGDPVGTGLAASLARPGGNLTGLSNIASDIGPKQIELLKEMIPALSRVAVLVNPGNSSHLSIKKNIQSAARQLATATVIVEARTPDDIERGFSLMNREHAKAVIVAGDAYFVGQRPQILRLAAKYRIPSMFEFREDVLSGGLLSYGRSQTEMYRQGATFVDKILKGAKPSELPIEQPTKFELVINRKTAKALGITIPQSVLLRANEVVE